ncbi:MAG TPA: sigma-70 family RNA polymerase sigma factor [Blastocatellia bacterium]|nr:sigma-70 family RNA polymerase sigma factor [Blastocatellia bacterium]
MIEEFTQYFFSRISSTPKAQLAAATAPVAEKESETEAETEIASDIPLVNAARMGDRAAFDQLYFRYSRMVHGILLARAPRTEVDDLVQDVFLFAWRKMDTLREAGAFGGWLAMIARNRAFDFHRRKNETDELTDSVAENAMTAPQARTEAIAALNAIRSLPEAYRETLILRLVEGMTGPEIAARTGLTAASVRVNLHRGMKLLREKLDGKTTSGSIDD